MAEPQTIYTGAATARPLPKARFSWDGAGTLTTGDVVCFDLSVGDGFTVTKPLTADLSAPAGIYLGHQGGSIADAQEIDLVPIGRGSYGCVVTVNVADDVYAVGDAIGLANDSFSAIILQKSGPADAEGFDEGIIIESFFGLALEAGTDPGSIKVFLAK